MRAVIQRVKKATVSVAGKDVGAINVGLCVFLGVTVEDQERDAFYLADKIANLRIFTDKQGKMNLSLIDIGGDLLVISQFTLYGDCRTGRRPSFSAAALPEIAESLYDKFIAYLRGKHVKVEMGIFQADMLVSIENDGPVTFILDSQKLF